VGHHHADELRQRGQHLGRVGDDLLRLLARQAHVLGADRVLVDVLGTLVSHGKIGSHRGIIDKPVTIPVGPDVE